MMVDKRILDSIELHTNNYKTFIGTMLIYLSSMSFNCEDIIFQSNFAFGGSDVPCTIYIHQDKLEDLTLKITIYTTENDWNLFEIDNPSDFILAKEWRVNDILAEHHPEWNDMSPIEIYKAYATDEADTEESFIINTADVNYEKNFIETVSTALYEQVAGYVGESPFYRHKSVLAVIYKKPFN